MNPRSPCNPPRRKRLLLLGGGCLGWVVLFPLFSSPLPGQERLTLPEVEALYQAARDELRAAVAAWEVLLSRWQRASEEFDRTPPSNRERRNAAFAQTQTLAAEVRSQERRVQTLEQALREARKRYTDALVVRLDSLLGERSRARTAQDSLNLAVLITDTNHRYQTLVAEAEDPRVSMERTYALVRDPRDGPDDLRRKAAQEEFRASQYRALLEEIDRRLQELKEAQRRDRSARDFLAGLDRFGDSRLPVTAPVRRTEPGRETTGVGAAADTAKGGRPLSLEERIADLEVQRGLVQELMERALANAAQFRRWAGGELDRVRV